MVDPSSCSLARRGGLVEESFHGRLALVTLVLSYSFHSPTFMSSPVLSFPNSLHNSQHLRKTSSISNKLWLQWYIATLPKQNFTKTSSRLFSQRTPSRAALWGDWGCVFLWFKTGFINKHVHTSTGTFKITCAQCV